MQIFSRQTLVVQAGNGSVLKRAMPALLVSILLVTLSAEWVARSAFSAYLPAPSLGVNSLVFDAKMFKLESQFNRDGRLDCLFIGSSSPNTDIDPAVIESIFKEQTGRQIHCYNFGVPLFSAQNSAALARALIERFHPKVVFYVALARDFDPTESRADGVEHSPWLTYQNGKFSSLGWVINNSYAYRYFLTWRLWLNPANRAEMLGLRSELSSKGFDAQVGFRQPYPKGPPTSEDELQHIWNDASQLEILQSLLAGAGERTQIVMIEGPQFRTATDVSYWQAYERAYIPPLSAMTIQIQTPFWRTDAISAQIPSSDWHDWIHLNQRGAVTFSRWLGEKIAENAWLFK